jgi:hypothetical protein
MVGSGAGLATTAFGTPNNGPMGVENSWIQMPSLLITQDTVDIDFDTWQGNENGSPCSYDVEHVEYSTDGGASWISVTGTGHAIHSTGSNNSWIHYVMRIIVTPNTNVL